jgi:hypothetical protein
VDVGQDRNINRRAQGIQVIHIDFDQAVDLSSEDVAVRSTGPNVPEVVAVDGVDANWTILLDAPLPPGHASAISIGNGLAWVAFGSLPGDVNRDWVSDEADVTALEAALEEGTEDQEAFDVDRNGVIDAVDLARLAALLDGADGGKAWNGEELDPASLTLVCCCSPDIGPGSVCDNTLLACPPDWRTVPCPCTPSSCR